MRHRDPRTILGNPPILHPYQAPEYIREQANVQLVLFCSGALTLLLWCGGGGGGGRRLRGLVWSGAQLRAVCGHRDLSCGGEDWRAWREEDVLGLAMASPLERGWLVSGNKVATIEFAGVLLLCPFNFKILF